MSPKRLNSGRKKAVEAEITRDHILASASTLFSTKGFDATSLREIAQLADVTHSTITHHFGAKQDIWYAISDRNIADYQQQLAMSLAQVIKNEHEPLAVFKTAVEVLIDTLLRHPQLVRLISMEHDINSERAIYLDDKLNQTHHMVSSLFDQAKAVSPRLQPFNADTFLVALLGLISAPALFPILQKTLTQTDITDANFNPHYKGLIINILFGE